jgi:hypothetical protein
LAGHAINLQVLAWLFVRIAVSLNPPCDSETNANIQWVFPQRRNNKKMKNINTLRFVPELRSTPCVNVGPVTFVTQAIPPNGAHMTQV